MVTLFRSRRVTGVSVGVRNVPTEGRHRRCASEDEVG